MPARAPPPLQDQSNGNNSSKYAARMRPGDPLAEERSPSETRKLRKLQKSPAGIKIQKRQDSSNSMAVEVPRMGSVEARKPAVRKSIGPLGARPQVGQYMKLSSDNKNMARNLSTTSIKMVEDSRNVTNNTSDFNFGPAFASTSFLPEVNFDDFQANFGFPQDEPKRSVEIPSAPRIVSKASTEKVADKYTSTLAQRQVSISKPSQESSTFSRQTSLARQRTASQTDAMGPPTTLPNSRARRQSHFPSSASATSMSLKAPRKSGGPGTLPIPPSELLTEARVVSGPELANSSKEPLFKSRSSHTSRNVTPDRKQDSTASPRQRGSQSLAARTAKAKSMLPSTDTDFLEAQFLHENPWATGIANSPVRDMQDKVTTPLNRRLSMMPGHATGLGARTISPTDARRMKRLSMMVPDAPPLPFTPPVNFPEPPNLGRRSAAESPSMIPRMTSTPSSSRVTPDVTRRPYSSQLNNPGPNLSSQTNTRPVIVNTRFPSNTSTSRLPLLKGRSESSAATADEEVPPVPAIPKAYESPKTELENQFFTGAKFRNAHDTISEHSASTAGYVSAQSSLSLERQPSKADRETRTRRGLTMGGDNTNEPSKPATQSVGKRNLQPLRLPPFNLAPLNIPTTDKIAALQQGQSDFNIGDTTPPPRRGPPKTPSTPMTASKATFFSGHTTKDEPDSAPLQSRSSSFHHRDFSRHTPSSDEASVRGAMEVPHNRKAVSPFVSYSLPKASGEFNQFRRGSTADRSASTAIGDGKTGGLHGPRALTSSKPAADLQSPPAVESSSFGSTLRRKLSLTRRRSNSKLDGAEHAQRKQEHDAMPPPKLPASATWAGAWHANGSQASLGAQKSQFLQSRRKSSFPEGLSKQEQHDDISKDSTAKNVITEPALSGAPIAGSLAAHSNYQSNGISSNQRSAESYDSRSRPKLQICDMKFDRDDLVAEEEMKRLASKRKNTEMAAKELDALRVRAIPKERVSPAQALRTARLNIFERGEIVDYKEIYFCGTNSARKHSGDLESESLNFGYDDERGDYNIVPGDHLSYRYEIIDILGKGSFGQVVRCIDHKHGILVAIKIIRNKKRFHQQALVEVDILQKLREWDPNDQYSMISFTQSFYFRGHLCISTELLGMNLYEFIKVHDFRGFSLKLIRRFTKQLLNSLVLLKSHKVIHCDLKPENILLAHPAHSEIKVIDFGSSCLENEKVYTYIQSRFYRSPEVILGMNYGLPIDIWSLGCILAELLTGYPIFPGENEQEQLACIMEVFGPPDKHLIEKSTRKKLFFDSLGKPRLTVSSKGKRRRPSSKTLSQALKCDDEAFLDFLTRCLRWDPERRLKPDDAIHHEFITGIKPQPTRNVRSLAQPSSLGNLSSSPVKRYNSVHQAGATARVLPETPSTTLKNGMAARARDISPSKPGNKRHTVAGVTNGMSARKPAAIPSATSATSLRHGGTKNTTGRPDLAAAAAAAATATRQR